MRMVRIVLCAVCCPSMHMRTCAYRHTGADRQTNWPRGICEQHCNPPSISIKSSHPWPFELTICERICLRRQPSLQAASHQSAAVAAAALHSQAGRRGWGGVQPVAAARVPLLACRCPRSTARLLLLACRCGTAVLLVLVCRCWHVRRCGAEHRCCCWPVAAVLSMRRCCCWPVNTAQPLQPGRC